MQSLSFEQIGIGVATMMLLLGFYINIRKLTLEQNQKFSDITESFSRAIADMNLTLTKLNTTLEFTNKENERLSSRATVHGKEIDELRTNQAVNKSTLEDIKSRIVKLETKCHSHDTGGK